MLLDNSNYRFGSEMYTNKFNTDPQSAGYSDHMMAWSAAWVLCIQGQCTVFFPPSSTTFFSSCKVNKHQNVNNNFHTSEACLLKFFLFGFKLHKVFSIILKFEKNLCASGKTKPCIKKKTSAIQNRQSTQTYQTAKQRSFWSLFSLWKPTMLNNNKNQSTDVKR